LCRFSSVTRVTWLALSGVPVDELLAYSRKVDEPLGRADTAGWRRCHDEYDVT
jgi:hypothetical protein